MREIKFRAFNKAERKMCRVVSIDFTGFITVRFPEFEYESNDYNDQMSIEEFEPLMQSTGLLDINRNEIYEGDLLKHPNGTIAEIKYLDDLAAFVAVYKQNGNIEMDYLHKEIVNRCIIVGNRYENPELLEVEGKMNEICPTCNGSGGIDVFEDSIGEIVTVPCSDCGGSEGTTDVARQALESDEN